jgi:hypothetical protein
MNEAQPPTGVTKVRARPDWAFLVGLALLLAGWCADFVGRYRVSQLDLSAFGPCEDVPEALVRDGYVARQALPYISVAVLLDGAAVLVLAWAIGGGRWRVFASALLLAGMLSLGWHGLLWFVTSAFAL